MEFGPVPSSRVDLHDFRSCLLPLAHLHVTWSICNDFYMSVLTLSGFRQFHEFPSIPIVLLRFYCFSTAWRQAVDGRSTGGRFPSIQIVLLIFSTVFDDRQVTGSWRAQSGGSQARRRADHRISSILADLFLIFPSFAPSSGLVRTFGSLREVDLDSFFQICCDILRVPFGGLVLAQLESKCISWVSKVILFKSWLPESDSEGSLWVQPPCRHQVGNSQKTFQMVFFLRER